LRNPAATPLMVSRIARFNCSWVYEVTRLGVPQTFIGDLTLEAEDRVNAFQKDFFTKFVVPDKVGP